MTFLFAYQQQYTLFKLQGVMVNPESAQFFVIWFCDWPTLLNLCYDTLKVLIFDSFLSDLIVSGNR